MKKITGRMVFSIICVLIVVLLVGCSDDKNLLDGEWTASGFNGPLVYSFLGSNVIYTTINNNEYSGQRNVARKTETIRNGTFSITDDQIEFTWTDATQTFYYSEDETTERTTVYNVPRIEIHDFSHTENTITIGRRQFTRAIINE